MNPFPLNKSFDDFIKFITSKESTNFMVRAVNTFERNNVEEQNSATNPVVIDDSGDEDNFEFPDVHVEDSTSGKKGPRTKKTTRTIPSNQPLDDKQQSPKKGTKKGKGKPKSGKKNNAAEQRRQISSATTDNAQQNHNERSSLQQVANAAIPVAQPTKLENGLNLLQCYDRLQSSFMIGKEIPIDNTRKMAIRKEIELCLTSEKQSDFKFTQRNINDLVKKWSKGKQIHTQDEDNDTNENNDKSSDNDQESSDNEESEDMNTDEDVDEVPFGHREDFKDSLAKNNSPSKQNITIDSTNMKSTATETTQQESTVTETSQQQPKLGATAKIIQQMEMDKTKKTQKQQKQQTSPKAKKRNRGGNTPPPPRSSKRLKGKGIHKR